MIGKMKIETMVVGMVATNCYLAYNQETKEGFLVDPGDCGKEILNWVSNHEVKLQGILLTHGHFDHVKGVKEIVAAVPVPIYAFHKEKELLEDGAKNLSLGFAGVAETYMADVFLKDEEVISVAGFSIRVMHTPGHTPGGCCYYIGTENVLFSGDTLFCGSVGRSDFPGGSGSTLIRSIKEKLMVLPEQTMVYPGHDSVTTIEEERMYNPYL